MSILSPTELLNWLDEHQFISSSQAQELHPLLPRFADSRALAKELITRDWLTPFQVNQLLQGKHDQLLLGIYRLRERIGEGAMGQVFKAWNPRLRRVVAVKTLHKDLASSPKVTERFRREVETASQLDHPNIALVRDADEEDGRPFMAMEFIDGVNISQRVKQQGPMPVWEAVEYARQVALGLQHALERGIVHRDIKPANLMITTIKMIGAELPLVKILDFGMARFESESEHAARLTQVGNLLGTVDYIAPEQAQNARDADIRADIYSLGCSLYYMLTAKPPFGGSTIVEKIGPRLTGEPPSVRAARADIPPGLDAILRTMMARLPTDRYQTPAEAAAALAPYANKEGPPPEPAQRPSRKGARKERSPTQPATEPEEADGNSPGLSWIEAAPQPAPAQAVATDPPSRVGTPVARPVLAVPVLAAPVVGVPVAAPVLAVPVAAAPGVTTDASASPTLQDDPVEPAADPAFLDMSATGRDMAAPAAPASAPPPRKFPINAILMAGFALGFILAVFVVSYTITFFLGGGGGETRKKSDGSIKITNAFFSAPKQAVKPGKGRLFVTIERIDFKGPVRVDLKDLPEGVRTGDPVIILANNNRAEIAFTVSYGTEPSVTPIRIVADCEAEGISVEKTLELKIIADR